MTCAIANGGELIMMSLIRGITADGKTVANEKKVQKSRIMTSELSAELRKIMISAVYENGTSKASSNYVMIGAKTSTAQSNSSTVGRIPADEIIPAHK